MKVAIEGCCHGELDKIYASIEKTEKQQKFKTDLLLLCGDFQAIRNHSDLQCLAVPPKYRQLGGFWKYYSGQKRAPILTIVIGGNHEASNYMWELAHGGWLAPNIYFLGEAGALDVGGVKIAGASGIFKDHHYRCGRFEKMPYDNSSMRSVYHTREYDIWRMKLLDHPSSRPDIVMSHDWPNTIEQYGDVGALIRKKPFFKDEINTSTLGSPPLLELLHKLRPRYWFSAHLHVKFAALFKHNGESASAQTSGQHGETQSSEADIAANGNPEALDIDMDDIDEDPPHTHQNHPSHQAGTSCSEAPAGAPAAEGADEATRFLALSKCLPGQDFLQFIDVKVQEKASDWGQNPPIRFLPRWLAILRATNQYLSLSRQQMPLPNVDDPALLERIEREEAWVRENLLKPLESDEVKAPSLDVGRIQRFVPTAPPAQSTGGGNGAPPPPWYTNPQTEALCRWLQIENKINPPPSGPSAPTSLPPAPMHAFRLGAPIHMGPGPNDAAAAASGNGQQRNQADVEAQARAEAEEIRRIEEAARRATSSASGASLPLAKRRKAELGSDAGRPEEETTSEATAGQPTQTERPQETQWQPLRLQDEDDDGLEATARWKEGTG